MAAPSASPTWPAPSMPSTPDAVLKPRKACLGYFCTRAARCGLYIQRIADTRPVRPWMPREVGDDCHHFLAAPDLDHPPPLPADLEGGLA